MPPSPQKETLIALYGADVTMADLRHLIAKCERHGKPGDACPLSAMRPFRASVRKAAICQ